MDHPTTRRLNTSSTMARYTNPVQVGTWVTSATQSRSGASAWNWRSTRSGTTQWLWSTRVVRMPRRRLTPAKPCLAHQTSHPIAAHPAAAGHQLGMDPRRPVGATRCLVDGPYRAPQHLVALRTRRTPTASPRVVPAGEDTQHPAHRGHPMMGLIRLHELEDFARTEPVSRANQAVAFASISRSSRS